MGSMTRQRARNRFKDALSTVLESAKTQSERESIYERAVRKLAKIAIDEQELDRVSSELLADRMEETPPNGVAIAEPSPEELEWAMERIAEETEQESKNETSESDGVNEIVVDGRFTSEGISVSAYDGNRNLLEETWFTWDEIEAMKSDDESHFTFEFEELCGE